MSVAPYPPPRNNYHEPKMMQTSHTYGNSPATFVKAPPSKTPIIKYTYIREENGTIAVYHQPTRVLMYHIITPSLNSPHVSIVDKHTSDVIWNSRVISSSDVGGADGTKIKPTADWECTNYSDAHLKSQRNTSIKFEKSLKGYVCSWNGRVFLWKLYGSGGDIYCVEGLSGIGERIAQFEDKSNTLMIDLSRRFASVDNHKNIEANSADSLKSFETFILMTGLIAKNSAKKLQSNVVNRLSNNYTDVHLFNYSGLFLFCGLCGTY
ncbi:11077_t:CDS:1 [Acaulospora colombiana]|uniref:11077_t:CDS:1 n=1 Tax=Acaulospora colombiana TaxID=27376 RepID=A0ACA9KVF9_9GLOM|nr:11077_t:CDS:1 [Acaulospora colombiana]